MIELSNTSNDFAAKTTINRFNKDLNMNDSNKEATVTQTNNSDIDSDYAAWKRQREAALTTDAGIQQELDATFEEVKRIRFKISDLRGKLRQNASDHFRLSDFRKWCHQQLVREIRRDPAEIFSIEDLEQIVGRDFPVKDLLEEAIKEGTVKSAGMGRYRAA